MARGILCDLGGQRNGGDSAWRTGRTGGTGLRPCRSPFYCSVGPQGRVHAESARESKVEKEQERVRGHPGNQTVRPRQNLTLYRGSPAGGQASKRILLHRRISMSISRLSSPPRSR